MPLPTVPGSGKRVVSVRAQAQGSCVVAFELYGTRASVSVPSADFAAEVVEQFPRDATPCEPEEGDRLFVLRLDDDGRYAVLEDGEMQWSTPVPRGALKVLRRRLFRHLITHARDRLVVHAGVVGHRGRAIVLPGQTVIGKTTLVVALLRAGADYYADDFAFLDGDGLVHPYTNLLFIKGEGKMAPESLGFARGDRPLPVGVVAGVRYVAGSRWRPRECTPGEGALMLVRRAYGLDAPQFALEVARAAVSGAVVLEAERGEAEEAAEALLETADGTPA